MKGSREIILSAIISAASFSAVHLTAKRLKEKPRHLETGEAITWNGLIDQPPPTKTNPLPTKSSTDKILIAVVDTGADTAHPSLQESLWKNPGESGLDENGFNKAFNGIDDDDNGFVDDIHGWNFVSDSPDVMDDQGHGTHIAGIIAGPPSTTPDVSLMILKYYDSENSGQENLRHSLECMKYAIKMGARIINYSGGGMFRSREEEALLKFAANAGVLVVAAAGNESSNSDFFHFYPADYDLPNILSVTAVDSFGDLLRGSNYGLRTVDLGAPGKNIYSTLPGGQFGLMSGTSQATAHATRAAAMVLLTSRRPLSPEETIASLLAQGLPTKSLKDRTASGKILAPMTAGSVTELAQSDSRKSRRPALVRRVF